MPWILRVILIVLPFVVLTHAYSFIRLYQLRLHLPFLNFRAYGWILGGLYAWWLLLPLVLLTTYFLGFQSQVRGLLDGSSWMMDWFVVWPFWLGLLFSAELLPLFLLGDIFSFVLKNTASGLYASWSVVRHSLIFGLAAFFFLYVPLRAISDLSSNRVEEKTLSITNLPQGLTHFRIVHISDVQADNRTTSKRMAGYIDQINRLKPDVVLFTGDLITRGREHIPAAAEMMGNIKARYGVFAVLGDHDYWTDPSMVRSLLQAHDVTLLEDTTVYLRVGEATLMVTAATHIYSKRLSVDQLKNLAADGQHADVRLFMVHQPAEALVETAAREGYHAFLAGHTHGGQVVFWSWLYPFSPPRLETGYWRGYYRTGSMLVSINNGLGLTLAPIRYHSPASINLIILSPAE